MLAVVVVAPMVLVRLGERVVKAAAVVVVELTERPLELVVQAGLLMVPLVLLAVPMVEQEL
tara:strand:+ start:539 stop:721 length:183 start_codon:yes stop_codon:yes gene_type:complete